MNPCCHSFGGGQTEQGRSGKSDPLKLVLLLACFLAAAFASQRFFHALSLARLEVVRVTLDFLNNVLGLYFPFKPPQRVLEGFPLLQSNFGQRSTPPCWSHLDALVSYVKQCSLSQVEYAKIFT